METLAPQPTLPDPNSLLEKQLEHSRVRYIKTANRARLYGFLPGFKKCLIMLQVNIRKPGKPR